MKNYDYIIVGGGMAGVLCAHQLKQRGQNFLMINDPTTPSASMIAAGTWNCIAFRRYVLSWRAEEFVQEMHHQYKQLEQLLNVNVFQDIKVKKVIAPGDELELWKKRALSPEMTDFMEAHPEENSFPENTYLGEMKQVGRILLKPLLKSYHQYLESSKSILHESFNYQELQQQEDLWTYKEYSAKKIIFCEGAHVQKNPHFSWIPLKPAKGDVVTIKAPELKLDFILKKNIFVLPLGNDLYKVGATYDWKDLSWEPSKTGREYLIEKLKTIINVPFEVIDQQAGIRPTAHDRRIIMGEHPDKKGLYVFNGFGTKGVLLGPLAAKEFADHLIDDVELNPEMSLERCRKYYK